MAQNGGQGWGEYTCQVSKNLKGVFSLAHQPPVQLTSFEAHFNVILSMLKHLFIISSIFLMSTASYSQKIQKVKMADVVKSFSNGSDTVYVVNFWATFCKPCVGEIPYFINIANKYKGKNVKLLLVSLDLPSYYPAKIASFAKKNKFNTNIAWLSETNADIFCPMVDETWSGAIPATIIVNAKTGYKKFFEDEITAAKFEEELKKAL